MCTYWKALNQSDMKRVHMKSLHQIQLIRSSILISNKTLTHIKKHIQICKIVFYNKKRLLPSVPAYNSRRYHHRRVFPRPKMLPSCWASCWELVDKLPFHLVPEMCYIFSQAGDNSKISTPLWRLDTAGIHLRLMAQIISKNIESDIRSIRVPNENSKSF